MFYFIFTDGAASFSVYRRCLLPAPPPCFWLLLLLWLTIRHVCEFDGYDSCNRCHGTSLRLRTKLLQTFPLPKKTRSPETFYVVENIVSVYVVDVTKQPLTNCAPYCVLLVAIYFSLSANSGQIVQIEPE